MRRHSEHVLLKQARIAELAKQTPAMGFYSLMHHLDMEWLMEAYWRTRKDGAPGVDRQTWEAYGQELEGNLRRLIERLKAKRYRAPPVLRKYIPKGGKAGEYRPLGIPTLEDKVLQRAVVMLLEPIYAEDFSDDSYGFRTGRSPHQAVEAIWRQAMKIQGGWVLELDIRKFFDEVNHQHLRAFLKRRLRDGALLRLIGKWLKAGVMEEGLISYPEAGTPQGGVISPLLANIYLHYVLDEWYHTEVKPRLRGYTYLVRFADDAVLGFSDEADARRVLEVLPKRFARFELRLHPEKTRLIDFRKPRGEDKSPDGPGGEQHSFEMLGFNHYWAKSRKGKWVIKRKTASSRLARSIRAVHEWCKKYRHKPLAEQQRALNRKLQGHCGYYGITGNSRSLNGYRYRLLCIWRYWLSRRNRKRLLTWERFNRLLSHYPIRPARTVHSVCRA